MFPEKLLEDAIRAKVASAINDRTTPHAKRRPEVDSSVMVRVILRVKEEIALDLPEDMRPSGGFDDIENRVATVMEARRELWSADQPVKRDI